MKRLLPICLILSLFYSCASVDDTIKESKLDDKLLESYSESIQRKQEDQLEVLKFVYLENDRYKFDKEAAINADLNSDAISQVEKSINDTNKEIELFEKEVLNERMNNKRLNIEIQKDFIDFQKINIDSIKGNYKNFKDIQTTSSYFPGEQEHYGQDISTDSTYPRKSSVKNVRSSYVGFESMGKAAPVSSHKYRAQSSFGRVLYAIRTGSAYTTTKNEFKLYTSGDKLFLEFSCSDPNGCIASYRLFG